MINYKNTNSNEIFSLALGLVSPWFIEDLQLVDTTSSSIKELHIYINFHKGHTFTLPDGSSGKNI